jgi:hypothetical protein
MRISSCSAIMQTSFAVWTGVIISVMIVSGETQFAHGQVTAAEDGSRVAPPTSNEVLPSPAAGTSNSDVVQFAGGAIEIQVPAGWHTHEVPIGRELRIWLTEDDIPEGRRPQDGVWMTFHWRGHEVDLGELRAWLDFRTDHLDVKRIQLGEVEQRQLGAFPVLVREVDREGRRNWILLAATKTGIFELTATADLKDFQRQRAAAEALLAGIKLSAPQIRQSNVRPEVQAATPAVGLWKSLQARLWLGGDGRVVMDFDQPKNFRIDESGNTDYDRKMIRLTGQYEAREDVIFISWDDGSRLNFRWRVEDGQLLLTDHNGRVSQLFRLVD